MDAPRYDALVKADVLCLLGLLKLLMVVSSEKKKKRDKKGKKREEVTDLNKTLDKSKA